MDRAAVSEAANLGSNPGGSTSLCMSEAICEGVTTKRVTLANIGTHSMLFRSRRRKQVKGNKRGRLWSVFF